ncbi:hypothetical protein C8J56DRAFT_1165851 [Mycena floridula]|nr:hypothetical protein C8J56DRAFT_1165851 [Mycena floridula]
MQSSQPSSRQHLVKFKHLKSINCQLDSPESNLKDQLPSHSRLPSGTTPDNLEQWWAPHLKNRNGALRVLLEASLLEHQATTYFVLPVIRSYLLDPLQPQDDIHDSMVTAACSFLQQYRSVDPGQKSFQHDMQVQSIEQINLQAILLQTSEFNTDVIKALETLAWHQCQVRPRTEVIQHARKLLQNITNQHRLAARIFECYAVILYSLTHYQESLQQHNLAREAYFAASEPTLAAWALIDIAKASTFIDSSFNEIPLLEQAQHELESINEGSERWRKATSQCLMCLGVAHSRHHNFSEALEHLTRARGLCSDLSQRLRCAYHLADAHYNLQELDEAEKITMQTINERKQIGSILECLFSFLEAIKSLKEGLQFAMTYGNQQDTANILLELGRAYMKMSKDNDAKKSFSQALVNYGNLEGTERRRMTCQYYLNKLHDPSRLPTLEEEDALKLRWHKEDIPGNTSVVSPTM